MGFWMTAYLATHWDGWILHSIIAALLMHPIITNSYPKLMFGMHVVFWPMREAWQHEGLQNILTPHRILEATAPIAAAFVVLLIALRWPYRRKK
jgi:hypothetical protein